MDFNFNARSTVLPNIDNCNCVILSNEGESSLQFSNHDANGTVAIQPGQNKNEKKNERDTQTLQSRQDKNKNNNEKNATGPHSQQEENEYDTVDVQPKRKQNENKNEYATVVQQLQQDKNENEYDKLDFQSGNQTSMQRENYANIWENSLQFKSADINLMQPKITIEVQPEEIESSRSYSEVNLTKKRKNAVKETDPSDH